MDISTAFSPPINGAATRCASASDAAISSRLTPTSVQLESLQIHLLGGPLHFGGVVDRVGILFAVPGGFEPQFGRGEIVVALRGRDPVLVERLRQARDFARFAALQGPVDLPRITARRADQLAVTEVSQRRRPLCRRHG
jgi:hypothetical protein